MSFTHQNWDSITIGKTTKTSENSQTVVKQHVSKPSNGIKVEKIIDPNNPDAEPETRPVMITHTLSQQIQQARVAKGLTQKELANALSIPVSVINEYERGDAVHNINYITKIKNYLGIRKQKPSK
jgi:ribosome-binding protein aMBF1 (putative translation factor)